MESGVAARLYRQSRPGWAVLALAVIAALTAGWWALALYPASQAPEWLLRTRLACFGARPGELPNAGGWLLLIGQPVGLLAVLIAVWGDSLARDLSALLSRKWGRVALVLAGSLLLYGAGLAGATIYRFLASREIALGAGPGWSSEMLLPELELVDQSLRPFALQTLAGQGAILTFAYAHCETVCPVLVREVLRIRRQVDREDVPLVIVTLDPWRDVPARLPAIARQWGLLPHDRLLSGSVGAVTATLERWNVGWARDGASGEVSHATVVVVVNRDATKGVRLEGSLERLPLLLRGL